MDNKSNLHDDYHYYEIVRKNIRKYRKQAHLTQQELADRSDITMHYVAQIESEKTHKYFTLAVIGRIADALNIDIKKFFDDVD